MAGTTEDPLREGVLERQNPADPQARTPGQDNQLQRPAAGIRTVQYQAHPDNLGPAVVRDQPGQLKIRGRGTCESTGKQDMDTASKTGTRWAAAGQPT